MDIPQPNVAHRWVDAARTMIARSDGAFIPADPANSDFAALDMETVQPFQRWPDIATARAELKSAIEQKARALRVLVAGTDDATKLAVYREKYAVAIAVLAGDAAATAALQSEADARGVPVATLAALVKSLGDQWTAAGLAIDAAYQGHKSAIEALGDLAAAEAYDTATGWPF